MGIITDHFAGCLQIYNRQGGEKVQLFCTQKLRWPWWEFKF